MTAALPRPINGTAVFTSYDGLRAEANGALGPLTFDCRALEMRAPQILAILPPTDARGGDAFFFQALEMQGAPLRLVGRVKRITDLGGRPGILGTCISCAAEDRDQVTQCISYLQQLFDRTITAHERWRGRGLPERLGVLEGVPRRETPSGYRFKTGTALLHAVDPALSHRAVTDACFFDLIERSDQIGRVLLLPFAARGTKPVDQRFFDMVRTAAHKKATQQSINDILRRQVNLERRVTRLEQQWETPSVFVRLRRTLHRRRVEIFITGGVVGLFLVLSVGGWFLFQTFRDAPGPTAPRALDPPIAAIPERDETPAPDADSNCDDPALSVPQQGDCKEALQR